MAGLVLDGVTKRYGADSVGGGSVTAVDGVNLAVPEGELLVLVGPSGCGKTTLLRLIAGLERPDEGEVSVGGRRVTDLPARERDVSLVFQDFALFPHLTARENVSFDLRMQGYDDVDRRVREAAELLDIGELLDRSIDELSGGQKQRIALGRAIVTEPSAFLLDEPLANLDANLRERMQTEIARLQDHLGVTTVHVTHDQAEALQMGDRVAVVSEGRVEQVGTPESVYRAPETLFVAQFVGNPTMNLLRGRLERRDGTAGFVAADGDLAFPVPAPEGTSVSDVPDGRSIVLGVRPEQVAIAEESPDHAPGDDGWVEAHVQFDEYRGADRFVYVEAPGGSEVVARVPGPTAFDEGQRVAVSLTGGRVHYFDGETGERLPVVGDAARTTDDVKRTTDDVGGATGHTDRATGERRDGGGP